MSFDLYWYVRQVGIYFVTLYRILAANQSTDLVAGVNIGMIPKYYASRSFYDIWAINYLRRGCFVAFLVIVAPCRSWGDLEHAYSLDYIRTDVKTAPNETRFTISIRVEVHFRNFRRQGDAYEFGDI